MFNLLVLPVLWCAAFLPPTDAAPAADSVAPPPAVPADAPTAPPPSTVNPSEPPPGPAAPAPPADVPAAAQPAPTPVDPATPEAPAAASAPARVAIATHRALGIQGITGTAFSLVRQKLSVAAVGPTELAAALPAVRSMAVHEAIWQRENLEVSALVTEGAPLDVPAVVALGRQRGADFVLVVQLLPPAPNGSVNAVASLHDRTRSLWELQVPAVAAVVLPGDPREEQARLRQSFVDQAWLMALDPTEGVALLDGANKAVGDDLLPMEDATVATRMGQVQRDTRIHTVLGAVACATPLLVPPLCILPGAALGLGAGAGLGLVVPSALPLVVAVLLGLGGGTALGTLLGCTTGCTAGAALGLGSRVLGFVLLPARRMGALQAAQRVHNLQLATRLGLNPQLLPPAYFPPQDP
jgi:hypothetical protein